MLVTAPDETAAKLLYGSACTATPVVSAMIIADMTTDETGHQKLIISTEAEVLFTLSRWDGVVRHGDDAPMIPPAEVIMDAQPSGHVS